MLLKLNCLKHNMIILYYKLKFAGLRILSYKKPITVFISVPMHGNLGDQAIVYAQYQIMNNIGINNIIEITAQDYHRIKQKLTKWIKKDDIIIIDGGGNIGTLWDEPEKRMRKIISTYKENYIFVFPNTAYYENSDFGKLELDKDIKVYTCSSKLTVFCRDSDTYKLFQNKFPRVKSFFTPDIAMYLNESKLDTQRKNVLFCFRDDREKVIDNVMISKMQKHIIEMVTQLQLNQLDYVATETSTIINEWIRGKKSRNKFLKNKWNEFCSAKFVITDRLHGMIFCAITGTPCIALDNVSHKIKNGYEWIKHLSYIKYAESLEDVYKGIDEFIINNESFKYNKAPLDSGFDIIKKEVRGAYNSVK